MRLRLQLALAALAVPFAVFACSGDDDDLPATPGGDGGQSDATTGNDAQGSNDASPSTDGNTGSDSGRGNDGGAEAGVVVVDFDPSGKGQPDALYWSDARKTLYITDDTNAIWSWTDAGGLKKLFTVPNTSSDGGAAGKLNGITQLPDGTLVVTQFGFGTFGGLLTIGVDGGVTQVPNVPPAERRIQVVRDPATGTIYSDSFQKSGQTTAGVVETVDLANGTTTLASGFQKPVGLLVQGSTLLVVDQNADTIYALPTVPGAIGDGGLADGAPYPIYATLPSPDQLTAGPNGTVFSGQFKPTVDGGTPEIRQISPDGGVSILGGATYASLSDVAYDASNKRLFVVDSNGTTLRTIKIVPVP